MLKTFLAALLLTFTAVILHAQTASEPFSRFRVAASAGYAYRLGKKPRTDSYFKEISKGASFNGDVTYYFRENMGAGLKYSLFSTSGSSYKLSPSVISNIKIQYIGPIYQTRITGGGRFAFITGASLGYMHYQDKGWIDREYGTIKGGSLGALLEMGMDVKLTGGFSFGLNASLYGGSLSSIKRHHQTVKLDDGNHESLSRIEASAGFRYALP